MGWISYQSIFHFAGVWEWSRDLAAVLLSTFYMTNTGSV